eukprot:Polyplicarium_translucidae@DN886_c0_g1_i1.p4
MPWWPPWGPACTQNRTIRAAQSVGAGDGVSELDGVGVGVGGAELIARGQDLGGLPQRGEGRSRQRDLLDFAPVGDDIVLAAQSLATRRARETYGWKCCTAQRTAYPSRSCAD